MKYILLLILVIFLSGCTTHYVRNNTFINVSNNSKLNITNKIDVSTSRLGPHILPTDYSGANIILNACPKVAKWILPDKLAQQSIDEYKKHCQGAIVVLRVYIPSAVNYSLSDMPASAAQDFWARIKAQINENNINKNNIDWLEGPNELDNVPNWYNDATAAKWFAAFWSKLADLMNADGYHPLVGSVVAGQPNPISNFCTLSDIMKTKNYQWGWSYHAYTIKATKDVTEEGKYALYYRKIISQCSLQDILIHTEGGYLGNGTNDGWQNHLTAAQYVDWLKWFDTRLKEDHSVIGLTIFQVGDHAQWSAFDITPIANDLANYLRS